MPAYCEPRNLQLKQRQSRKHLLLQHTSLAEPDRQAPDNIHAYVIEGGA